MNIFTLMAGVTICYTITSLSDKYAASRGKLTSDEFTFLMCSSLSLFLLPLLLFYLLRYVKCWNFR